MRTRAALTRVALQKEVNDGDSGGSWNGCGNERNIFSLVAGSLGSEKPSSRQLANEVTECRASIMA
jgi:hypothetical protein